MTKIKNFIRNHFGLLMAFFAGGLFVLNFIRIFDSNFWLDETYSIDIVHLSLPDLLRTTGSDVHPPLYYLILLAFCKIFGYHSFVYHLVSLIPYAIILILSLTVIKKTFGNITSLFVITFSSLLTTSVEYNVQVRMYSWGALFVMLSFYALYQIFKTDKTSAYILFTASSLCAAYTHYYLLIGMAGFYGMLMLATLIKRRKSIKKVILTYLVTIVCYSPWLIVLLKTMSSTSDSFWIKTIPSLTDSLCYLFGGKLQLILVAVLFATALSVLLFDTKILMLTKDSTSKNPKLTFSLKRMEVSCLCVWIASGFAGILLTIAFGFAVSYIIRPMFLVRYLFPLSTIAWIILGVCISRLRFKNIIAGVLLCAVLVTGLYSYAYTFMEDRATQKILTKTLEQTSELIDEDDVILASYNHYKEGVARYYYGVSECYTIVDGEVKITNPDQKHWLFLDKEISDDVISQLNEQGYGYNTIVTNGNVGTYKVHIYEVVSQ